jgi:parallel beta-helix repeat protein
MDARTRSGTPATESIVNGSGGAFNVQADSVTIDGFTIQGATDPVQGTGIYLSPAGSGYSIRNNIIQNNVFGLYLHSEGTMVTEVRRNRFATNNEPGAANGNGIYSDQGLHNAIVRENEFEGNANAAMILTGTDLEAVTDVTITKNDSLMDGAFLVLLLSRNVDVTHNTVRNSAGTSIFIGGDNSDLWIAHNKITDSGTRGIRFNTTNIPTGETNLPTTGAIVEHNQVTRIGASGIVADEDALVDSTISKNNVDRAGLSADPFVADSRDGIQIRTGNSGNLISKNNVTRSFRDGLRMEAGSSGNTISMNNMSGSGEHDCHDDSVGGGTAGTDNTWSKNTGNTENVPGLCPKPTPPGKAKGKGKK